MKPYEQMSKKEKLILLEQESLDAEILYGMAHDFHEDIRFFVTEYLGNVHTSISEQLLLLLMDDPDEQVRVEACDSVCWCDSETVLEKLMEKSICDTFLVRGYSVLSAADVLMNRNVQIEMHKTIEILKQNLCREKSVWVRMCYEQALYRLGNSQSLYKLFSYLSTKRYNYRCCAINLLMDIVSEKNSTVIMQTLENQKKAESNKMLQNKLDDCISRILTSDYCRQSVKPH